MKDTIIKKIKLPRKIKKEIKKWFLNSFPNHPGKWMKKTKTIRINDNYSLGIYYDCMAEKRLGLYK